MEPILSIHYKGALAGYRHEIFMKMIPLDTVCAFMDDMGYNLSTKVIGNNIPINKYSIGRKSGPNTEILD